MRRLWLIVGLVLWGTAVFTTHVFAHTELVSARPAPGSTVQTLDEIRLEFSEPVSAESEIQLLQDFSAAAELSPLIDANDATILYTAVPTLPDGVYTVQWKVVGSDGHPMNGSYSLGVDSTLSPISRLGSSSTWLVGGLLLLALVSVVIVARRWQPASAPRRDSVR